MYHCNIYYLQVSKVKYVINLVLLALYFSIFNFSLFYLTGILMSLMLIKNKRSMIILFSITLIACVSIYFDIIKTNLMIINQ